jgi:ParB family chromosome partitioning protein
MVETMQKGRLAHVPLNLIDPGDNPRDHFDDEEQAELDRSVEVSGVMTPIILRDSVEPGRFVLVAGERRIRAATVKLGLDYEIPAIIFDLDETEALLAATIENVVRSNMSPAEESKAAAKLLAFFAGDRDEVARRMGMNRPVLDKRLALMNASDLVLSALTRRKINLGHAELLAAAPKAQQNGVLTKLMEMPVMPTVAEFKAMLAGIARPLATACFDKTECASCPNNSDLQQAMFSEAIAAGNCTNGECYKAKTEAELLRVKAGLADTFPRVEIVREGDNYSVIKLVVEGSKGVGDEQAKACRTCANFGAVISAIPGKEGRVFEDHCFDTGCNTRKVAKQLKAAAAAAVTANPTKDAAGDKKAGKATAKEPAKVKASASAIPAGVLEFRKKVWRTALRTKLATSPRISIEMLIAICLDGAARNIVASEIATDHVAGLKGSTMLSRLKALSAGEGGQVSMTVASIASTALDALTDDQVKQALQAYEVDLKVTFAVDADYLKLLTKTEIDAVAKEIGLAEAFGTGFAKLMGGKKDEAIKAILAVKNFDFHVIPGQLAFL